LGVVAEEVAGGEGAEAEAGALEKFAAGAGVGEVGIHFGGSVLSDFSEITGFAGVTVPRGI
jgi:hypothetical protein